MPRVVLLPTFHDHETVPVELAVLSPRPAAVDGPDLYSTSIEQRAFGEVLTDTDAVLFRGTVAVRELTFTGSVVDAGAEVGFGFGPAVGFGVLVGLVVVAGVLAVAGDATVSVGAVVASDELAPWPTKPKPKSATGALGGCPGVLPPSADPIAAARITTAIRMPIHVRGFQPVLGSGVGSTADAVGGGFAESGLESEV